MLFIDCFNIHVFQLYIYKNTLDMMFLFFLIVHNTFVAAGVKRQHVNGELQLPTCTCTCIDGAAIDTCIVQMKGKMSF